MRCLVQSWCMGFHVMDIGPMTTYKNRLHLKEDLNAKLNEVYNTSCVVSLFQPTFHGVPFELEVDPWCFGLPKSLSNKPWNYFRCITTYLIVILQRHGHILSILRHLWYQWPWISVRSYEVVDFGTNWKRAYDFLLVLNSNLGAILPRFGYIRAFVRRKPLFWYPSPILAKISGCSPWSRCMMLGSSECELDSNLCDHSTSTSRTDGQMTLP